ncbi:MAG: TonB-dependent receptor [Novosphingobium sp.]|nr:TonB-dependent receptor [Novosphingobium sp.]
MLKKSGYARSASLAAVSLALAFTASAANAQAAGADSDEAGRPGVAQQASANDGDIIVTARKREERVQDVPAAITAINTEDLQRYNTSTITQISTRVPSLVIGTASGPGGSSLVLRGIGTSGSNPTLDQSVALNIDGVQLSRGTGVTLGNYDLERVEVLEGPQALFYGKNSIAGIVSLVSADPGPEFDWRFRSAYEFEGKGKTFEGMVSVPLTDTLGVRLVGAYQDQDGWFRNRVNPAIDGAHAASDTAPNQRTIFGRATVKYEAPDDSLKINLKVAYSDLKSRGTGLASTFQYIDCPLGAPQLNFGVPGANADCKLDRYVSDKIMTAGPVMNPYMFPSAEPFYNQRNLLASLATDLKLSDNLTLTSMTGYYRYNESYGSDYAPGDIELLDSSDRGYQRQFTQELRLASSFAGPVNFLAGGFYQHETFFYRAENIFFSPLSDMIYGMPGPIPTTDDSFKITTNAYSFFGQVTVDITSQLELSAGGRYSTERKGIESLRYYSATNGFSPTVQSIPFDPAKATFHNFSPDITLRYRPNPDTMLYAAYRQGFTSGGFNGVPGNFSATVPNDAVYKQSTARGVEGGIKGALADRQFDYSITVYRYNYRDLQASLFVPQLLAQKIVNAGRARSQGVEVNLSFSPRAIEGLTLRTTLNYGHARYLSYPVAGCYAGQSIAQGCNIYQSPLDPAPTLQDLAGQPLERAPDLSLSLGFNYDVALSDSLTLSLNGTSKYTSSYVNMSEHDPRAIAPSAWIHDAQIALKGPEDGWEIALIGRNLTNKLLPTTVFAYPFTGSPSGLATSGYGSDLASGFTLPRSIFLQVTLKNTLLQR